MNRRVKVAVVLAAAAGALPLMAGTASASVEGPVWNHPAHAFGTVTVEDHTGDLWPVSTAVAAWGSGYHYGRCRTAQCVRVYEDDEGADGVVGTTSYTTEQTAAGERFVSVVIRMNDHYGATLPAVQRREAVTHELGHALGLDHDSGAGHGVMYAQDDGDHTVISVLERTELRQLYLR
jgi:predicted Zn-dependent protease